VTSQHPLSDTLFAILYLAVFTFAKRGETQEAKASIEFGNNDTSGIFFIGDDIIAARGRSAYSWDKNGSPNASWSSPWMPQHKAQ